MKILVTGGCGYVGSVLIPKLLSKGIKVINIDTQYFGNYLKKNRNLENIKCNINEISKISLKNVHAIIHLASIANDPMAELNKNLSWETSALGTYKLLEHAKKYEVKRFIYASSGSVYGISKKKRVDETTFLKPISLYNKVKMCTEKIVQSYQNEFDTFIIRPATVCGYSPRMRYDVSVNVLTFNALKYKKIRVFGGRQIRPNIHIDDMVDLYIFLLDIKKKYCGIYNAGFENMSILNIAKLVQIKTNAKIIIQKDKNDPRSYRLDSLKLLNIGFKPKKKILDAITTLLEMSQKKLLKDREEFHSIKFLKKKIKNL